MYTVRELAIAGVLEIIPARISDDRGYFSEVFRTDLLRQHGINADWVQDNQAFSRRAGVLRGLHYQRPPMAQDKLVRAISGAILDVAVDIRKGSPTFGKWLSLAISAEKGNQIFVPKGFAHGYRTLEPNTLVLYKVSAFYSPRLEATIRYDDPELGVDWQLNGANALLSQRDASAPALHDQPPAFSI